MRYRSLVRFAVVVLGLTACGFSASTSQPDATVDRDSGGRDARPMDALADANLLDTLADTPPVWTDIESINVPCKGTVMTSTTVLATATTYRLRSSDTCVVNVYINSRADAEWHYWNIGSALDGTAGVDNGLAINDTMPGPMKQPRWGAYSPTHSYTVDWLGTGATVTARYHDSDYTNNDGALVLTIQALQ